MGKNNRFDRDNTNSILENGIDVIPTGIPSLDKLLGGGLPRSSFTLIASRPAMGKTCFAIQLAGNIASAGKFVYFCSMKDNEFSFNRKYRKQTGTIPTRKTLYFDDQGKADVPYITEKIRSLAKCDVVFVDYLQLMLGPPTPDAVTEIVFALKELARNENIPVVLTSQIFRRDPLIARLNYAFRPELSDLSNVCRSGALTQSSDIVIFPFRESFHVVDTEINEKAELIVAKNHYSATGSIPVHWNPEKLLFEEKAE